MGVVRFKVFGTGQNSFNGQLEATVTIDRGNNLVTVRPKRMHKTYTMRLEDLARGIIYKVVVAELQEKKKAKAAKKKIRRGR